MPDIKTRDTFKGTIKTLDRAKVASARMKSAYIQTKTTGYKNFTVKKHDLK